MNYEDFLARKSRRAIHKGISDAVELSPLMFGYQADVTRFLLQAGSGAAFLDTGMGKSFIELEWARVVREHTNKPVLMLAPLAVGPQHVREAERFGIDDVRVVRNQDDVKPGINVANYERLHLFDPSAFGGIVLDESSIIKNYTGKTTRALMAFADSMPFRLCATATPAPNDHMELGQHSQFLGAMDSSEMLARWFIADQSEMGRYRLKRHGIKPFWSWVASWARCLTKPSDLGYSDDGFQLPTLNTIRHSVDVDICAHAGDEMFRRVDASATAIHKEKRITASARAARVAEVVNQEIDEPWVIWCDTDYEAAALMAVLPDAVEVKGSDSSDFKEAVASWFCGIEVECTCGSQSTQRTVGKNTKSRQKSEIDERLSLDHQRKTETTCGPTTSKTKTSGQDEPQSNRSPTTNSGEKHTEAANQQEKKQRIRRDNGSSTTLRNDLRNGLDDTELLLTSTETCLRSSQEGAQFAEDKVQPEDCESIIAIQREGSGAYSATHAISALESSAIRQTLSKRHCAICGLLNKKHRILVTKPKIFGFGLNFQHCARTAFIGLSFSYEQFYQATRRFWRYGQQRTVDCHVVMAETEDMIWRNIQRKAADHETMKLEMAEAMKREVLSKSVKNTYQATKSARIPKWIAA